MTWDVPNDAKKHAPFCSRSTRKASADESYFSFAENCEVPPAGLVLAQVLPFVAPNAENKHQTADALFPWVCEHPSRWMRAIDSENLPRKFDEAARFLRE
jgi:hypothetical protein